MGIFHSRIISSPQYANSFGLRVLGGYRDWSYWIFISPNVLKNWNGKIVEWRLHLPYFCLLLLHVGIFHYTKAQHCFTSVNHKFLFLLNWASWVLEKLFSASFITLIFRDWGWNTVSNSVFLFLFYLNLLS